MKLGNKLFLIFILLISIFAVSYFGKNYGWEKLAKIDVSGKVVDLSNGSPIEMVTVHVGSGTTYTNYEGRFHWEDLKVLPKITLDSPTFYEPYKQPLACKEEESPSFLRRRFSCSAALIPGPEIMVFRVVNPEIVKGGEKGSDIDARYNSLWVWLHPEQKPFLGQWESLRSTLKTREEILKELKKATASFERLGEVEYQPLWTDPVSKRTYENVAEVEIRRKDLKGRVLGSKEHFAKYNNIWYYFLPFTRDDLIDYVKTNSWVLKVRQ